MQGNFLMTCLAMAAVIITVSFLLLIPGRWQAEAEQEEPREENGETFAYELTNYKGKLAVCFYGDDDPQMVLDVYIHTLPDYDQKQLDFGVPVKDYEELLKRIEDYSS